VSASDRFGNAGLSSLPLRTSVAQAFQAWLEADKSRRRTSIFTQEIAVAPRFLTLLVVLISFARPAAGQGVGAIAGTVTDSSGAVQPGAAITLSSAQGTLASNQEALTDARGAYQFPRLVPGTYVVRAQLQGFRTVEQRSIIVTADQTARADLTLPIGQLEKRLSNGWMLMGGVSLGKNVGDIYGTEDLNNPNFQFRRGIQGNDVPYSLRLSGICELPYRISFSATYQRQSGFPEITNVSVGNNTIALVQGTTSITVEPRGNDATARPESTRFQPPPRLPVWEPGFLAAVRCVQPAEQRDDYRPHDDARIELFAGEQHPARGDAEVGDERGFLTPSVARR
jgi:hypothetical protein